MTAEREGLAEELHEAMYAHRTLANSPGDAVCACDRTWRPTADYRAHLADALADHLAARDRRVRAGALREAADAWPYEVNAETIRREIATLDLRDIPPEYRVDDWLRDRADRIEAP